MILQDKNYPLLYLLPGPVIGDDLLFDVKNMKMFCEYLKGKFSYAMCY